MGSHIKQVKSQVLIAELVRILSSSTQIVTGMWRLATVLILRTSNQPRCVTRRGAKAIW